MFRSVPFRFIAYEFVPFRFYKMSSMFRSVPFLLNSFRSVSTKYWLCSVSICSFPFRLNSFRSVSTKYRICSVSFCPVPFRSLPPHSFRLVSLRFYRSSVVYVLFLFIVLMNSYLPNAGIIRYEIFSCLVNTLLPFIAWSDIKYY